MPTFKLLGIKISKFYAFCFFTVRLVLSTFVSNAVASLSLERGLLSLNVAHLDTLQKLKIGKKIIKPN